MSVNMVRLHVESLPRATAPMPSVATTVEQRKPLSVPLVPIKHPMRQAARPASATVQLALQKKKNEVLERRISEISFQFFLQQILADPVQHQLNVHFNGFGILVLQANPGCLEVVHAAESVVQKHRHIIGSTIIQYHLDPGRTLSLTLDSQKSDNATTVDLEHSSHLSYDLRIPQKSAAPFQANAILKLLQPHLREKAGQHQSASLLFRCYSWILIGTEIGCLLGALLLVCTLLITSTSMLHTGLALTIGCLCVGAMGVRFVAALTGFDLQQLKHRVLSEQYSKFSLRSLQHTHESTLAGSRPDSKRRPTELSRFISDLIELQHLFQHTTLPRSVLSHYRTQTLKKTMDARQNQLLRQAVDRKTQVIQDILENTKNPNMINISKIKRQFNAIIV